MWIFCFNDDAHNNSSFFVTPGLNKINYIKLQIIKTVTGLHEMNIDKTFNSKNYANPQNKYCYDINNLLMFV